MDINRCLDVTKRAYPEGYGFALEYLKTDPDAYDLVSMRDAVLAAVMRRAKAGNQDAPAFLSAFVGGRSCGPTYAGWAWWLIEAAQLVHSDALAGNAKSRAVMVRWQHPGF